MQLRRKWMETAFVTFSTTFVLLFTGCANISSGSTQISTGSITIENRDDTIATAAISASDRISTDGDNWFDQVPDYSGHAYVEVNGNTPFFNGTESKEAGYEFYSSLDRLGRCGAAYAYVGLETMPTEERGAIGQVKPTGWQTVKYDIVDGKYLYNRCHLIGYQLTAENANTGNLITGTRYLNIDGMLPFENMVADYVKETENHVQYRVTPVFEGENLVASGVLMEGRSDEDSGDGVLFCVYAYNVQPGIHIDYATGNSSLEPDTIPAGSTLSDNTYILNNNSKKFHLPSCSSVSDISDKYRQEYTGNRDELISEGYAPCKRCNP